MMVFHLLAAAAAVSWQLHYDNALSARGFPSPLLCGTVRNQAACFIVDTGASVHTLASWLVSAARVPTFESEATTTGSTGVETRVRTSRHEAIRIDGAPEVALEQAIVVDFPRVFEETRIGGLVSPQLLAPAGSAAVLDLRTPTLTLQPFDAAVAALGNSPAVSGGRVCTNAASTFTNRQYASPMTADGIDGDMLVDTGATGTLAATGSRIAQRLGGRATDRDRTQGVGGASTATAKVPNVAVGVGSTKTTVSLGIGGAMPACGVDGLLGMDVLRRCILVLGQSAFASTCAGGSR